MFKNKPPAPIGLVTKGRQACKPRVEPAPCGGPGKASPFGHNPSHPAQPSRAHQPQEAP
jgi:hypothetical protein